MADMDTYLDAEPRQYEGMSILASRYELLHDVAIEDPALNWAL